MNNQMNQVNYFLNKNEIDDTVNYDRSVVEERNEKLSVIILKIIANSLLNNIVSTLSRLILTINLILLGHIPIQNKTHYELFMTYQIGVAIVEFFGKLIIIGLLKYLFEKKESEELYYLYLRLKTALIFIIPFIMIPVSISSYFIIKLLLNNNLDIYDQSLNKQIYFKYIIFTPIIYFFEILFYLNLQLLRSSDEAKALISYLNAFIISHIVICLILLYILKIGIVGLTFSYCLSSFLFYLFSNVYISKSKEDESENFLIIPFKEYFKKEVLTCLKEAGSVSLRNLSDSFIFYLLFIASLFTDRKQLIVNIIYLNFYDVLIGFNKGLYLTLRNYLLYNKEATIRKKKYVIVFSLASLTFAFTLFILLIIFKNILLKIYLINGGDEELQKISESIKIIYAFCVLFNMIQILLYGFIRGMVTPSSIYKNLMYSLICLSLCVLLCFYFDYGIIGLWLSILIMCFLYICENAYRAIFHFKHFFF